MKGFITSLLSSLLVSSLFTSTPVSYFRNMVFKPYEKTNVYQFDLEFAYPVGGAMTLEVRLSNGDYERALVFGLNVSQSTFVRTNVNLYPYLFDSTGSALLHFRAYRNQFESTLQVRLYEKESKPYVITNDVLSIGSNKPTAEVNAFGVVTYRHETIALKGFQSIIVEPYYYAMHFRYWSLTNHHAWKMPMTFIPTLRITTRHPAFTLIDQQRRINKLLKIQFKLIGQEWVSDIHESLYVDPKTLYPSHVAYEDYVATDLLFFPLNDFSSLQRIYFEMAIVVHAVHTYVLTYAFSYETLKPLIGPCYVARYCVGVRG